jgi:hypothetical protein
MSTTQFLAVIAIILLFCTVFIAAASVKPKVNLAPVPSAWRVGESWCAPTFIDYSIHHNGNCSIRMERGNDTSKSREILAKNQSSLTFNIKPGDHVIFKVWMKTSPSTINDTSQSSGVRFGVDLMSTQGRICALQTPDGSYWTMQNGYPANQDKNFVSWNSDWTLRVMEFTVQKEYPTDGLLGGAKGEMLAPVGMIPWVQVWSNTNGNLDCGVAWFADVELYIT